MEMSNSMYDAFYRIYKYTSFDENRISPGQKLNDDCASLVERMRSDGYTEEEIKIVTQISREQLEMAAKIVADKSILAGITKSDNPSFYHVAGQPGCGKSAAISAIKNSLDGVPFTSEMDVYRTKHPRIVQIKEIIAKKYPDDLEKQGKEFVAFTSLFADMLELTVISYMISEGYSVIKETTGKNFKGICGMIEALKSQYPQMTASMACMAVAQEVSIDGTITRGETMNNLTTIFVEDLKKVGIKTRPVGRGNVPRSFSEDACRKIPGSMAQIANSGLINGEFLIVKRGKEDSIVVKISGSKCKENSGYIMSTLTDRIIGEKAKEEEKEHFLEKNATQNNADIELEKGNVTPIIEIYLYPTVTWLNETDGALEFYKGESGLSDIKQVARWLVEKKMLPVFLESLQSSIGLNDSSKFDEENAKANELLNSAGEKLSIALSKSTIKSNAEELIPASKK